MKKEPYKYTTKYGEKTVEAATMFDVNKAIMRCLVKNLAMFGLGLYIYAGEDLPEEEEKEGSTINSVMEKSLREEIRKEKVSNEKVLDVLKKYNAKTLLELKVDDLMNFRKEIFNEK